jgi:hypothetical protein
MLLPNRVTKRLPRRNKSELQYPMRWLTELDVTNLCRRMSWATDHNSILNDVTISQLGRLYVNFWLDLIIGTQMRSNESRRS